MNDMECAFPFNEYPHILLAHGGGGKLMDDLIRKIFVATFGEVNRHDGALLNLPSSKSVMTTDSFVVNPLFFPGGSIGKLAVYGTVNDLVMCGACPGFLSLSFILEEGLAVETLLRICQDIKSAAEACEVSIVTGDTKVVERGKGDGIYINTTGIGSLINKFTGPETIMEGDAILLNGDLGRHGMAIMAQREGLEFKPEIESDCTSLWSEVKKVTEAGIEIRCMRDLTRGGLASCLNELSAQSGHKMYLESSAISISGPVKSACELLGLNPYTLACEGRCVLFVSNENREAVLRLLGPAASCIGHVGERCTQATVIYTNELGVERFMEQPPGDLLPRIC
jgi:hydrogenase expression/formation protein HypE